MIESTAAIRTGHAFVPIERADPRADARGDTASPRPREPMLSKPRPEALMSVEEGVLVAAVGRCAAAEEDELLLAGADLVPRSGPG